MDKNEQLIMVVKKGALFDSSNEYFEGFQHYHKTDYESIISQNIQYVARGSAEQNPDYKQPIPYCIIFNPTLGKIYAYSRAVEDSKYHEKRLQGKWSWGVGGHIEKQEESEENPIKQALLREIKEELEMNGGIGDARILGYINDDRDNVGKVHFGILYVIETNATEIKPRDGEIEKGEFKTLDELREICSSPDFIVEGWSEISLEPLELFLQNLK